MLCTHHREAETWGLLLGVLAEPGLLLLPTCQSTKGSSLPSQRLSRDCSLFPLEHHSHWSKKGTICSEACPSPGHLHLPQLESNPNISPWEILGGVYKSELAPSWFLCELLSTGGDLARREGHLWCALGHSHPQPQGHSRGKAEANQGCSANTSTRPDLMAPSVAHINLGSLSQQENLFGWLLWLLIHMFQLKHTPRLCVTSLD